MTGQFIRITLSGSPEEIGLQHGKLLSEQIHRNIEFYKPIFLANLGDEAQVLQSAECIKEHINAFNPNYITEIDHLALGTNSDHLILDVSHLDLEVGAEVQFDVGYSALLRAMTSPYVEKVYLPRSHLTARGSSSC